MKSITRTFNLAHETSFSPLAEEKVHIYYLYFFNKYPQKKRSAVFFDTLYQITLQMHHYI